jgi:hypothetical protein
MRNIQDIQNEAWGVWEEDQKINPNSVNPYAFIYGYVVAAKRYEKNQRPPEGLKPKRFHDEERFEEICKAIKRYQEANKKVPIQWHYEYNDFVSQGFDDMLNINQYKIIDPLTDCQCLVKTTAKWVMFRWICDKCNMTIR